jgi:hypothetical protein
MPWRAVPPHQSRAPRASARAARSRAPAFQRNGRTRPPVTGQLEFQPGDLGLGGQRILRHPGDDALQCRGVVGQIVGRDWHARSGSDPQPLDAVKPMVESICRSLSPGHAQPASSGRHAPRPETATSYMDGNGPSSPISGRRVSSTDLETIPPVRRGIAAASLVGPAQVGARIVEFRLLRSFPPDLLGEARFGAASDWRRVPCCARCSRNHRVRGHCLNAIVTNTSICRDERLKRLIPPEPERRAWGATIE